MNYVNLNINQGIGTVEFFTEQSNSLPGDILKILAETITEAGKNERISLKYLPLGKINPNGFITLNANVFVFKR